MEFALCSMLRALCGIYVPIIPSIGLLAVA
jgi:hypothetical protein